MTLEPTTTEEAEPQEEEEEEEEANKTKKKKKVIGLATVSPEDLARITKMGQEARLLALARMKKESNGVPLRMGLAVLDEKTRHRIAKMGGLTRAADKLGLSRAGKLGGKVVREVYGTSFYQKIGKKGAELKASYSTIDRKGAEAVKASYTMEYFTDLPAKRKKDKKKKNKNKDKKT